MNMGFLLGFAVGAVVSGVVFIVFAKNNKNKIAEARKNILDLTAKAEGSIKEELNKINNKLNG
jgi:cbb3-type cytochrome oxidase subunit 3